MSVLIAYQLHVPFNSALKTPVFPISDVQKKQPDVDCSSKSSPASGSSQASVYSSESSASSSAGQALLTVQKCSEQSAAKPTDLTSQEGEDFGSTCWWPGLQCG